MGQYGDNRRHPRGVNFGVWTNFRRAFQPCSYAGVLARGDIDRKTAAAYIAVQIVGAVVSVLLVHAMFDVELWQASGKVRTDAGQWLSEAVATFGLLMAILGCLRHRAEAISYAVGLYITAGYWFTASTSFANPAVTIARLMTDSFSGICGDDMLIFIGAQLLGAFLAYFIFQQFGRSYKET